MRTPLLGAVCLAVIGCTPAPSSTEAVTSDARAILDGKVDSKRKAVVAVYRSTGDASGLCTGTLIMPDLVLTARHCVSPLKNASAGCGGATQTTADGVHPAASLSYYTETTPSTPVGLPVAEVLTLDAPVLCGNDLALLRLEAPASGVTPIALRLDGPPVVGETLTVAGYGLLKPGDMTNYGTRRSRSDVTVASVDAASDAINGEWTISEGPCQGDSGGPALDATGASVGVASRDSKHNCQDAVYERLDVHADWLRQAAQASADRLGVPVPAWASGSSGGSGQGGGAGSAGASSEGPGGAGSAGAPDQGGQGGGEDSGASGEGGTDAGTAGTTASGGSAGSGPPTGPAAETSSDDGGCSMGPASARAGSGAWLLALAAALGASRSRPRGAGRRAS